MRAAWLILFFTGVAVAAEPLVGIGHIPIAVRDLDAASADYRALGFTLKASNPDDFL
jgi:catechol-2,3-dioxygenase